MLSEPLAAAETDLWTTEEERAEAARFGSARRRSEYLTWRTLVRRELGRDAVIGYNGVGAPVVTSPEGYFIGVSHCRERVAVCISRQRCAVDIESVSRNFGAALARCMTPRERTLSTDERLGAALWCAKEALYKYAGRRELELQRDVQVLGVDFEAGRIVGRICGGEPLELQLRCIDDCVVVWRC
ncbi:4'-phosphopantetheinyl transferase superfamily protein [Alistipes sp. Marseille-P5061]|uniref:4'-phosphopantetheinyl transferase family protein n=1 Tax=Alistipes sp. Marseille-P5061 TaxID=2048242 RepID=UPI001F4628DA|nr:4'-phosphopantetheinyl transferase superfamily protein [Alistipes sp. Marseille-P5061]